MKTESTITTSLIIAATITTSAMSINYTNIENTDFLKTNVPKFENQNSLIKTPNYDEYNFEGTSTTFWSNKLDSNKINKTPYFKLSINSIDTIEIAQTIFQNSLELDEIMTIALNETLDRIGKNVSDFPNRL